MVLNEKQRKAKRKLIEENRQKRKNDAVKKKQESEGSTSDVVTDTDRDLLHEITTAYENTAVKIPTRGSEVRQ